MDLLISEAGRGILTSEEMRRDGNRADVSDTDESKENTEDYVKEIAQNLKDAAALCLENEALDPDLFEVSLSFSSEEEIRELNRVYRGVDDVTDVLSFPMYESEEEIREAAEEIYEGVSAGGFVSDAGDGISCATDAEKMPGTAEYSPEQPKVILGDVVICARRAREQAEMYGHSFVREIVYLFVHSILHLLGYDHTDECDRKFMRAREEKVMDALGISRDSSIQTGCGKT